MWFMGTNGCRCNHRLNLHCSIQVGRAHALPTWRKFNAIFLTSQAPVRDIGRACARVRMRRTSSVPKTMTCSLRTSHSTDFLSAMTANLLDIQHLRGMPHYLNVACAYSTPTQ